MKGKLSKMWRSGLSMFLALCMLIGISPAAFAVDTEGSEEPDLINYVSLGDSMTNGYGLAGYKYESVNVNGYLQGDTKAYPSQFAAWLAGFENYVEKAGTGTVKTDELGVYTYEGPDATVNHTQLAMSAMRAEDLHFILEFTRENESIAKAKPADSGYNKEEYGSNYDVKWWNEVQKEKWNAAFGAGDFYTWDQFTDYRFNDWEDTGDVENSGTAAYAEKYQSAIADADIVSLAIGNGNFGVFMLGRIMNALGTFGGSAEEDAWINVEDALRECDEETKAQINDVLAQVNAVVAPYTAQMQASGMKADAMVEAIKYTVVSYMMNYAGVIDRIVELKGDDAVEIMIVGLMNTFYGMKIDVNGDGYVENTADMDLGEMMYSILDIMNSYLAAQPTVLQASGKYPNATFYYAEGTDVEMLVSTYDKDITGDNDIRDRFITEIVGEDGEYGLVFGMLDMGLPIITRAEVEKYEKSGLEAFVKDFGPEKLNSVLVYKCFEDAVLEASKLPCLDLNAFLAIATPGAIDTIFGDIKSQLSGSFTVEGLTNALQNNATLMSLLNLFARMLIGDGLGCHPSANGHETLAAAVINAYDTKALAAEKAVADLVELVSNYYDEAYAYGYAYAKNEGYIDIALGYVDKLESALGELDAWVEANKAELGDSYADLAEEIDAAQATLAEIKNLIATSDTVELLGQNGLKLLNTLYAHVENIYDLTLLAAEDLSAAAKAELEALGEKLWTLWIDDVQPALEATVEKIITEAYNYIADALEAAGIALDEAYNELVEAVEEAAKKYAPEVADWIYDYLYNNPAEVIAFLMEYGDDAVAFVEEYLEELMGVLGMIACNFGNEALDYVMENADEVLAKMVEWASKHGENTLELIKVYLEELGICEDIKDAVTDPENIKLTLEALYELLEKYGPEILEGAYGFAEEQGYIAALEQAIEDLKAELAAKTQEYLESLKPELEAAIAELEAQLKALQDELKALKAELEAKKAELEKLYGEAVEGVDEAIAELEKLIDQIEATIKAVEEKIAEIEAAIAELKETLAEIAEELEEMAEAIEALEQAIEDLIDAVENNVSGGIDAAVKAYEAARKAAMEAVEAVEKIYEEAVKAVEAVKAQSEDIAAAVEALEDFVNEQLGALAEAIEKLPEAVQEALKEAADAIIAEAEKAAADILAKADEQIAALEAELAAKLAELEEALKNAAEDAKAEIEAQIEALKAEAAKQIEEIRDAAEKAAAELLAKAQEEAAKLVEAVSEELQKALEAAAEELKAAVDAAIADVADMLEGATEALVEAATGLVTDIAEAMEDLVNEVVDAFNAAYVGATVGDYVVNNDSYYVSIGDSSVAAQNGTSYGALVAAALKEEYGVDVPYSELTLDGMRAEDLRAILDADYETDAYGKAIIASADRAKYIAEIEKADLITVGLSFNSITDFVTAQLRAAITGGEVAEMDWSKYVGADGVKYIEAALADLKANFVEQGMGTYQGLDVAELMVLAVESYAYGAVGFACNYTEAVNEIHAINPDALVLLVGMYNPLEDMTLTMDGLSLEIGEYVDYLVELSNLHYLVYAMLTPGTVMVKAPEVQTLREADAEASNEENIISFLFTLMMTGTENLEASAAGHEYIKTQILNALNITTGMKYLMGDVNLDGVVDPSDTNMVFRYVMEDSTLAEFSSIQLKVADVNLDGVVDPSDTNMIFRYVMEDSTLTWEPYYITI